MFVHHSHAIHTHHVVQRAGPCDCALRPQVDCQPKVGQLQDHVFGEQDVLRLDVPTVCRCEWSRMIPAILYRDTVCRCEESRMSPAILFCKGMLVRPVSCPCLIMPFKNHKHRKVLLLLGQTKPCTLISLPTVVATFFPLSHLCMMPRECRWVSTFRNGSRTS